MSWTEIIIQVAREHAEALSDALMASGALSVAVEDADEGTAAEKPLFGEPGMLLEASAWERSRVLALTEMDADHATMVAQAAFTCRLATAPPFSLRAVADQDWVRLTQSQFTPIPIGKNIWVVPSWHDAPDPAALILELDPGLAFGTGSHPTTRLCMEWLEANPPHGLSVLDYGCGSGILALVAKKLGATLVAGVDIDPQAIASAEHNARRNQCDISYFLPTPFAGCFNRFYDVVVANILSGPLILLAPVLTTQLAPRGALVLSGILTTQADQVIAAYAPFLDMTIVAEEEGWVALVGHASALLCTQPASGK